MKATTIQNLYKVPTTADGICLTKDENPDWILMLKLELLVQHVQYDTLFKTSRRNALLNSGLGFFLLVTNILMGTLTFPPCSIILGIIFGMAITSGIDTYYYWKILRIFKDHENEVFSVIRNGALEPVSIQKEEE